LEMTLQIGYYKINQQEKRKPSGWRKSYTKVIVEDIKTHTQ
jgi:ribosomal protein L21